MCRGSGPVKRTKGCRRVGPVYKPGVSTTGRGMDLPQMTNPVLDFAAARNFMVDSQIRPNRVNEPRLIRALRQVKRERFLPDAMASMAYIDEDVPLGGGRYLMEPMVLAQLIQLARPREGERALVIGAGPGYGAAVLAECGAAVTALEQDPALLAVARHVLPAQAPAVSLAKAPLTHGQRGPWDVILIEGAVAEIPAAIGRELNPHGGRLVTVLAQSPGLGKGVLAEPINPGAADVLLRARPFFDCATPHLPGFGPPTAFKF